MSQSFNQSSGAHGRDYQPNSNGLASSTYGNPYLNSNMDPACLNINNKNIETTFYS